MADFVGRDICQGLFNELTGWPDGPFLDLLQSAFFCGQFFSGAVLVVLVVFGVEAAAFYVLSIPLWVGLLDIVQRGGGTYKRLIQKNKFFY